jgi:signal transduction histidine kinase/phage shock protein PspC (stress-responsive transcriptional regulator)
VVGGVAQGMAQHLGVDPWLIRAGFVLLAFCGGAGLAAYAAFWALVPLEPDQPTPDRAGAQPSATGVAWPAGQDGGGQALGSWLGPLVALAAVALGAVLLAQKVGYGPTGAVAFPVLVLSLGVAMLWRVADDAQRTRWRRTATASATGGRAWVRLLLGLVLVVLGAAAAVGARSGLSAAMNGVVGALVVLAGVAVVAGPWLYRNAIELAEERRARIRSQERAEVAAHVHDSVVQTLTLIQRNADDPGAVTRLARAEERSLRRWLYRPDPAAPGSFRDALEADAADVEDTHGGAIDVVVVGDTQVQEKVSALLQAAREAMVNAAKYAGTAGPVSVYAEVEARQLSVFVRDRGPGFDVAAIGPDRLGVRQSIIGRMERNGGTAEVVSGSDTGTEVRLCVPLGSRSGPAADPQDGDPAGPAAAPSGERSGR